MRWSKKVSAKYHHHQIGGKLLSNAAYLNLLKQSLTASIYEESSWQLVDGPMRSVSGIVPALKRAAVSALRKRGLRIVRTTPFSKETRDQGLDWPLFGLTMVGSRRLDNLQNCIEDVIAHRISGCFVETGVWRGGSAILAKALFKSHNENDRLVWCCDSFEGMPVPDQKDLELQSDSDFSDRTFLVATIDQVKSNFAKFGLLDDNVKFLKGWFCDTLPTAPIGPIAVLRMDGDLYASTMDALVNLYSKVSSGGYVIVDDYKSWKGCREAVDEFRIKHGIVDNIQEIDAHAVYWQKTTSDAKA